MWAVSGTISTLPRSSKDRSGAAGVLLIGREALEVSVLPVLSVQGTWDGKSKFDTILAKKPGQQLPLAESGRISTNLGAQEPLCFHQTAPR
jgi:hypothetical protein